MKNTILGFFVLLSSFFATAQNQTIGAKFSFDQKNESDVQIVLADNYNYYMMSVISTDGLGAQHLIIIRKFDQKNQMVDTFTQDFKIDMFTLHNYRGGYQLDNNKVVVFIESYSNKRKVSDLIQYTFDKTTNKFEAKTFATYPIVSASKSGTYSVSRSPNNMFCSVVYQNSDSKKEPEVNECSLLDGKTLTEIWKKTVTFSDEFYSTDKIVTNSGKMIFVRQPRSYKGESYLTVITKDGQENKNFEENTRIHKPTAISIGSQDYLIVFNYRNKGIRGGDFGNIMLYDIEQGKALSNNAVSDFNQAPKIKDVIIRKVFLENNEIRIFAEGYRASEAKPTAGNSAAFFDPKFYFGPANLLVLSFEGELKQNIKLENNLNAEADLFQSYGVLNVNGNYIIHAGLKPKTYGYDYTYYKIDPNNKFERSNLSMKYDEDSYGYKTVNQLLYYFNDTNNILISRLYNDGKMSFVTSPLK